MLVRKLCAEYLRLQSDFAIASALPGRVSAAGEAICRKADIPQEKIEISAAFIRPFNDLDRPLLSHLIASHVGEDSGVGETEVVRLAA